MLDFEGGIIIFKTLAISKAVYFALITNVSKVIVEELQNMQKLQKIQW